MQRSSSGPPRLSAIRASESLLELDLSACHIADRGAELLAAAVEDNVVLDALHYDGNRLSVDATSRLSYALGRLRRPIGQILDAIQHLAAARPSAAEAAEGGMDEDDADAREELELQAALQLSMGRGRE